MQKKALGRPKCADNDMITGRVKRLCPGKVSRLYCYYLPYRHIHSMDSGAPKLKGVLFVGTELTKVFLILPCVCRFFFAKLFLES